MSGKRCGFNMMGIIHRSIPKFATRLVVFFFRFQAHCGWYRISRARSNESSKPCHPSVWWWRHARKSWNKRPAVSWSGRPVSERTDNSRGREIYSVHFDHKRKREFGEGEEDSGNYLHTTISSICSDARNMTFRAVFSVFRAQRRVPEWYCWEDR